jgi:predicted nuclease of predicted toxin-antitoxin system
VKFVIDMNLGPEWIACLARHGYETVHWSSVGPDDADDAEIMGWARDNNHVVLTADLDFGARLVRRGESGPSVVHSARKTPSSGLSERRPHSNEQTKDDLTAGALVTIENDRYRVRRLSPCESL